MNGASTPGRDNSYYLGALDFVTRVSRSYSIWFPVDDPSNPGSQYPSPEFQNPVLEPRSSDQPGGTSIEVAFRGSGGIINHAMPPGNIIGPGSAGSKHAALIDATALDLYGDHYHQAILQNPNWANNQIEDLAGNANLNDESWYENVADINGARFYQIRLTFRSNIVSNESPNLSAIALSWTQP